MFDPGNGSPGPHLESPESKKMMNEDEKSDSPVVSEKLENEIWLQRQTEDPVEKRGVTKGNPVQPTSRRTQSRGRLSPELDRIRQAVRKNRKQRLTNLWHHVCDVDRLREAYHGINRKAAAGIDEQSWHDYGVGLEARLQDLSERLHRGSYHPRPAKRHYIPKADGSRRPIAIPVIEDKIVQRATTEVLGPVYESKSE